MERSLTETFHRNSLSYPSSKFQKTRHDTNAFLSGQSFMTASQHANSPTTSDSYPLTPHSPISLVNYATQTSHYSPAFIAWQSKWSDGYCNRLDIQSPLHTTPNQIAFSQ
ncbi:hypothetical protein AVEN_128106-1 [Araneus ventricosus]|uniref:Uncharacterized protein n=1 Tax=Araneus ventricosus TaxID=182803 RepID=A0A4Y2A0M1_ARAVE|nr:hypothetical protein AVEN_128106-1 [Araneus ventricosus]